MNKAAVLAIFLAGCQAAPPPPPPAPPAPAREAPQELRELRDRIQGLMDRSADLKKRAHEALDDEQYERAATLHKEAARLMKEEAEARSAEEALVRAAAQKLIDALNSETLADREAATRELIELGLPPELLRALTLQLTGEAASRAFAVLLRMESGSSGRQWASGATASTEFSTPQWAAFQAIGAPNTLQAGDYSTAWASSTQDADTEWLHLSFDHAVEPTMIRVHETYNAGAVSKVEARDATGAWRVVWEGPAAAAEAPRWFEVPVKGAKWKTREVRLTIDSDAVPGWNEIDAVELVGRDPIKGPFK